jgi:polyhydroxybutyrate depolymerase
MKLLMSLYLLRALQCAILLVLLPVQSVLAADEPLQRLRVGREQRTYLLHDFAPAHPAPLVIVLHGGGGNGENAMQQTGFDTVARREGLVVAYPYGSSRFSATRLLTWNATHCCSYARQAQKDDVRFIATLIDQLVAQGVADPARVYVTGLSNGGMMTHRLALALPDRITAIAPVISSLFGDEALAPLDMPVLIINGAVDDIVKPEGGELGVGRLLGRRAADRPALPVASQRTFWAERNACSELEEDETSLYVRWVYSGCRTDAEVVHYLVKDNGHAWPGGSAPREQADRPVRDFKASEIIWEFFSRYPVAAMEAPKE